MKKSETPVVVEQTFSKDKKMVWSAISNVEEMVQWYFNNIPEFKAEVGFKTKFDVDSGERIFPHIWEVIEVIPYQKLVYNWQFDGYEGSSNSIFELIEESDSIKLRLTCEVLEDFSDKIPEFRRESCLGGWEYFIQGQLKEYLNKK